MHATSEPDRTSTQVLCRGAVSFLLNALDEQEALFSYSTTLQDGRYRQDFSHPSTRRYTINSLLGLKHAAHHSSDVKPTEVDLLIERFLERHYERLSNLGDLGLLLVLLASDDYDFSGRARLDALDRIGDAIRTGSATRLSVQELSWMLWGAVATARAEPNRAGWHAERIFSLLKTQILDEASHLPRHNRQKWRRDIISFGGVAYFLRALCEYARSAEDEDATRLFHAGVKSVMSLQGPDGQWPWMISVRKKIPLDYYPVFTVHQDSMAMLFLIPALEADIPGAREAIEKSFKWLRGANEVRTPMVVERPFFVYRSVERREHAAKARRYLRAVARSMAGKPDRPADGGILRINRECRSYHLGWVLYVWAGRNDAPSLIPGVFHATGANEN